MSKVKYTGRHAAVKGPFGRFEKDVPKEVTPSQAEALLEGGSEFVLVEDDKTEEVSKRVKKAVVKDCGCNE